MRCSLPHFKNDRQLSVNNFWHCIMKHRVGCAVTVRHNGTIDCLSMDQSWWQYFYYFLKMSVNRASTTFGLASWKMNELCGDVTPQSRYWPPFKAKPVATTSLLCPKNELRWSINDFWPCSMDNPRAVLRHWAIIWLSASFLGQNGCYDIATMS